MRSYKLRKKFRVQIKWKIIILLKKINQIKHKKNVNTKKLYIKPITEIHVISIPWQFLNSNGCASAHVSGSWSTHATLRIFLCALRALQDIVHARNMEPWEWINVHGKRLRETRRSRQKNVISTTVTFALCHMAARWARLPVLHVLHSGMYFLVIWGAWLQVLKILLKISFLVMV